jgi:hypothetical protein
MNLYPKAMNAVAVMVIAIGISVATLPRAADEEIDTVPATNTALGWLAMVDAGRYGQSWEAAAQYFRDNVTQSQWEVMLAQTRGKVGNMMARKVTSVHYARDLPSAPPGEYVVIQYSTRFENGLFTETVTPMKEKDGSWKVSGYYIK